MTNPKIKIIKKKTELGELLGVDGKATVITPSLHATVTSSDVILTWIAEMQDRKLQKRQEAELFWGKK